MARGHTGQHSGGTEWDPVSGLKRALASAKAGQRSLWSRFRTFQVCPRISPILSGRLSLQNSEARQWRSASRRRTELQRQSGNHQPPGSTEPFRGKPGRRPRRLGRPVRAWAGSQTAEVTRDALQKLLVGPPKLEGEWGTGLIPGDDLVDWARRQGVPDATRRSARTFATRRQ
jgi:hypothetical protein